MYVLKIITDKEVFMLPKNRPIHPGKFIKEDILKEIGITEKQLAESIGVTPKIIRELVNGKSRISMDIALRLGRFTKTSPEMWLNLQNAVDLWDAYHSPVFQEIERIQPYAA
jgi:addiction module HigA family antidote